MSKARQLAQKPSQPSGRKNLIINGAMDVHQRGGTITVSNGTGYTLDRFKVSRGASYNFNVDVSQSTTAPTDFVNSLKIDVQATATPSAGENAVLEQHIESQNTTHLNYGSSSGKYIVLSFWVRSNKTGTYGLQLMHDGKTRNFVNSYTISSADTWEKKTIVINPDTTGAAFDDDNATGLRVVWHLSTGPDDILSGNRDWTDDSAFRSVTGQVNLFDSTSNEFYITGVQLEVGTVATEFEHRSFGEELALCRRYYESSSWLNGTSSNINKVTSVADDSSGLNFIQGFPFMEAKRAAPTMTVTNFAELDGSSVSTGTFTAYEQGVDRLLRFTIGASVTTGRPYRFHYTADAEL